MRVRVITLALRRWLLGDMDGDPGGQLLVREDCKNDQPRGAGVWLVMNQQGPHLWLWQGVWILLLNSEQWEVTE